MSKYNARKTPCQHGHTHASAKEARRCNELHLLLRSGQISALVVEPTFELMSGGQPIKMRNGQTAKYRPDFTYIEGKQIVAEDVKGMIVRDFPLRAALFKASYPDVDLRVIS